MYVRGHKQWTLALFFEVARELASAGGLTSALQTHEQDARERRCRRKDDGLTLSLHERDQLVLADLDEKLARPDRDLLALDLCAALDDLADRLLLYTAEETLDDVELDVGFEQGQAHVAQRLLDVLLGQFR